MSDILLEAKALQDEIVAMRRTIHTFAEVGLDLPQTTAFVRQKLTEFGLVPVDCGPGITCQLGSGGKVLLLRCDMDALPMAEETGLPFAAQNGACHSCGHDAHTAMLLAAAKLLKTHESELKGTVKLMFQPAEEQLAGATAMIRAGVLENPKVDAAMALHTAVGREDSTVGCLQYVPGTAMNSGDAVKITVTGVGAHGSTPYLGVDAISAAAHIVVALEEIIAREVPSTDGSVLIVGTIHGGSTCNTVSGSCEMECSIRATSYESRDFLKRRIKEVAEGTAAVYRAKAEVEYVYGMPPLVNDEQVTADMARYSASILPPQDVQQVPPVAGTEDFTDIAAHVPACYFMLGAGSIGEGYTLSAHNPAMMIDESVFYKGAALYAGCAMQWLAEHQ
ncbi:amidohydrolase [Neobittarella massiliensis]|uniref:Amidohydrolase n=1 Tax=Neobittarella massiliensis (ex Bilen et al. 2018) TaxID=2041842 RepID=A0A8J6IKU5_9FIRM|nr:M20 family metallopeptidase [Neobittarella massiliensis]MBC3515274.1 amidohydrolase [Neobittarella massiliensis]